MQYSTQQKANSWELFWPKGTVLKSKSKKCRNLQKFVTEIFQVKIGLSPKLMNETFEFIKKRHSMRINAASRPDDPNYKIWHRNKK